MQKEFKMIVFKKVNTLMAKDITAKYADLDGPRNRSKEKRVSE